MLAPERGESPHDVVESLAQRSDDLNQQWSALDPVAWRVQVAEPPGNIDLGLIPLGRLPLLRLTEVEVHGADLAMHLEDWSDTFVEAALPMRFEWLTVRRANHQGADPTLEGSWLLVANDGATYRVSVDGTRIESRPAARGEQATAVIEASGRDGLAVGAAFAHGARHHRRYRIRSIILQGVSRPVTRCIWRPSSARARHKADAT